MGASSIRAPPDADKFVVTKFVNVPVPGVVPPSVVTSKLVAVTPANVVVPFAARVVKAPLPRVEAPTLVAVRAPVDVVASVVVPLAPNVVKSPVPGAVEPILVAFKAPVVVAPSVVAPLAANVVNEPEPGVVAPMDAALRVDPAAVMFDIVLKLAVLPLMVLTLRLDPPAEELLKLVNAAVPGVVAPTLATLMVEPAAVVLLRVVVDTLPEDMVPEQLRLDADTVPEHDTLVQPTPAAAIPAHAIPAQVIAPQPRGPHATPPSVVKPSADNEVVPAVNVGATTEVAAVIIAPFTFAPEILPLAVMVELELSEPTLAFPETLSDPEDVEVLTSRLEFDLSD